MKIKVGDKVLAKVKLGTETKLIKTKIVLTSNGKFLVLVDGGHTDRYHKESWWIDGPDKNSSYDGHIICINYNRFKNLDLEEYYDD